jgi:GTP-binding protein
LRITDCRFLTGARHRSEYPRADLPEIAFLGRSNVGKSSLINSLTGRKLTRVSKTPGRTQQANFYSINDVALLVDLPGYGYAKVPARVRAELVEIIESYLTAGRPLAVAVLIVDSRHEPSDLDLKMNGWLKAGGHPVQVVCTKVDKLSRQERSRSVTRCRRLMGHDVIIPFSSETGEGKRELWQAIDNQIASLTSRAPGSAAGDPPK